MRRFDLWAIIEPAPDVPGQWSAHVLDLDVVTAGASASHAINMAAEAAGIVLEDDLGCGREPLQRGRTTPDEAWQRLREILTEGARLDLRGDSQATLDQAGPVAFAVPLWLLVVEPVRASSSGTEPPRQDGPQVAFAAAS